MTFEEALAELEKVVQDLERGDISLDDSLARYERAVTLLKACHAQLQGAEAKVRELTGVGTDGEPQLTSFGSEVATPDRKRKARSAGE
ncbi:MAG: exodeoxyribonuclease VII small subunit [Gemmataceae bacterium]|nr:exodeoxyribonuclease VII small subunit [Gemmataceae bacterium]